MEIQRDDERADKVLAYRISNILSRELGGDETNEERDGVAELVVRAIRDMGWKPQPSS